MWSKTAVSQLLDLKYPIIQGPFGGRFSSVELVSKVSNLGGMGSFGLHAYTPEEILEIDREIKASTNNTYVLNLWVPLKENPVEHFDEAAFARLQAQFKPYFEELGVPLPDNIIQKEPNFDLQIEAILAAHPPVASFIFGIPSKKIIQALKDKKIISMAVATTVEEAIAIEDAGIDLVIASGMQAGGHRASFLKSAEDSLIPTSTLVARSLKHVKIPVIAAGGIARGNEILRFLEMGAGAVQLGTAFLATHESNATDIHKSKLLSPSGFETSLTSVFTGRLARSITTDFIRDQGAQKSFAPYPSQSAFLKPLRDEALRQNRLDFEAFWAAQTNSKLIHRDVETLFKALLSEITITQKKGRLN